MLLFGGLCGSFTARVWEARVWKRRRIIQLKSVTVEDGTSERSRMPEAEECK